jgi:hypothetical protein
MKTEKTGKTKKVHAEARRRGEKHKEKANFLGPDGLVYAEARRRRGIEVVHDAVQPFLEGGGAKINQ